MDVLENGRELLAAAAATPPGREDERDGTVLRKRRRDRGRDRIVVSESRGEGRIIVNPRDQIIPLEEH